MPDSKENKFSNCKRHEPAENSSKGPKKTFADIIAKGKKCVWKKKIPGTFLSEFKSKISKKYGIKLDSYWNLHKWSVDNHKQFWAEIWDHFDIICSHSYETVLEEGSNFIEAEWFKGAKLNYAENMLRYRDDHVALIYADEQGKEEQVTFAELFEKVKLYAAAMRNCGIKVGDNIGCYMSNRLEAVYVMLAATSIGAVFGGPLPFYGARAAANILKLMKTKFLFVIDKFYEDKKEFNVLNDLPYISENVDTIKKVIIISYEQDEHYDIGHIKNSVFIQDFLNYGKNQNGSVDDIVFEQLPFNHPLFISFTSGTTGAPKGLYHSVGVLLFNLRHYKLTCNLNRGDVVMSPLPCGWNIWNAYMTNLALGVTVLLYAGSPYFKSKTHVWDFINDHKVTYTYFLPSILDRMDKEGISKSPGNDLKHLRLITIGTSPVKLQNFEYLSKVAHEDLFVVGQYGCTELAGALTGFDFNLPVYSGELQAPGLGMDLRCLDEQGNDVYGKIGEIIIGKPVPSFPVGHLADKKTIDETYFSKFKGMWSQNDEAWRDPDTKGFVIIGRSDETLNVHGERFGSADIYFAIHDMIELSDYICVGQNNHKGDQRAVLFVKLREGYHFTEKLRKKIQDKVEQELTIDFIPEVILAVTDIPYNLNKKRMEKLVKTIVANNEIPHVTNIRNPECLHCYCNVPELRNYRNEM